jgi:hypothetical protein
VTLVILSLIFLTLFSGFQWKLVNPFDPTVLALNGTLVTDVPPNNFQFNFTVISPPPASTKLLFGYQKSWVHTPPVATVEIDLTV